MLSGQRNKYKLSNARKRANQGMILNLEGMDGCAFRMLRTIS